MVFCYRQEIRTATSSMTSVPKPLKFLRPHYGTLQAHYEKMADSELKVINFCFVFYSDIFPLPSFIQFIFSLMFVTPLQKLLADILSVLALTMSPEGERVRHIILLNAFASLWFLTSTFYLFRHTEYQMKHLLALDWNLSENFSGFIFH